MVRDYKWNGDTGANNFCMVLWANIIGTWTGSKYGLNQGIT